MLQVPSVIRSVFEIFPLKTYAPHETEQLTALEKNGIEQRKFHFKEDSSTENYFTLGVYKVDPYVRNEKFLVATDPVCLASQIILCMKNSLKLPCVRSENTGLSDSCLMELSEYATPDRQLPTYIEDFKSQPLDRKIMSNKAIQEAHLKEVSKPEELVLLSMVDTLFYDCWVYAMFDLPKENVAVIYDGSNDSWRVGSILENLTRRNRFEVRNQFPSAFYVKTDFVKRSELFKRLGEALQLWADCIDEFSGSVLSCKIAAYSYCIEKYCKGTELHNAFSLHPILLQHAYEVIEKLV